MLRSGQVRPVTAYLYSQFCKLPAGAPLGACRTLGGEANRVVMAYQSYSSLSRAQLTFEYLHTNS